jgi:hypothetical protein
MQKKQFNKTIAAQPFSSMHEAFLALLIAQNFPPTNSMHLMSASRLGHG